MKAPRKVTSTYLETLKPGLQNVEVVVDGGDRGHGALILRVTNRARIFYFRYFHEKRRRFELVGHFDPNGARQWRDGDHCFKGSAITLAAAREGYRELAQLAAKGDLKAHYAAEAAKEEDARRAAEAEARVGTFEDLMAAYVGHLRDAGKSSADDVDALFKRNVAKPFPILIERRANAILPEDIQVILANLVEQGITRGVNMTRSYLRAAFAYAGKAHDLDPRRLAHDGKKFGLTGNPVDLIPRIASFETIGERVLDAGEIRAYFSLVNESKHVRNAITQAALLLHLYTGGQRIRQLLAAPWSAYDLNENVVTLVDLKGRAEARQHLVPLLPEAVAILEALKPITGKAKWPFTTDGETCIRQETLIRAATEIRSVKADVQPVFERPFTLKDIRRTVETTLASLGVSKPIRAQLLSHGRGDKISQTYDKHHYLAEKRHALELWRDFIHGKAKQGGKVVSMKRRRRVASP